MADNSLEMKLTADFSDALTKTTVMNVEVKNLSAQVNKLSRQYLKAADNEKAVLAPGLQEKIAELSEMKEAAQKMSESVVGDNERVEASVEKVAGEEKKASEGEFGFLQKLHERVRITGENFEDLHARLSVFGDAFKSFQELLLVGLGLEFLYEQINKVAELGEEYEQLTEKTGATTTQLAMLKLAASESNVEFGTVGDGLRELGRNMQEAILNPSGAVAQDFRLMGIKIQDTATGQLLPVADVFEKISQKMTSYQDGTAKTALATTLLGARYGEDLIPVMQDVGQNTDELTEKATQYGLILSQNQIQAASKFEESQKDIKSALGGVRDEIVGPLLPAFADLSLAFQQNFDQGSLLQRGIKGVGLAARVLTDGLVFCGATLGDFIGIVNYGVSVVESFAYAIDAAGQAITGNFSEAAYDATASVNILTHAYKDLNQTIQANGVMVANSWEGYTPPEAATPQPPKPAPQPVDLGDWYQGQEATLGMSNAAAEKGAKTVQQAQQMVYQNTVNYWQKLLAGGKLNAQQRVQVEEALANAEVALKQSQIEVSSAADKAGVASARQAAQSQVEILQAQLVEQQRVVRAQLQSQISVAGSNIQIAQAELQTKKAGWNAEVAAGQMTADKEAQLEANLQKKIEDMQLERVNLQISAQNKIYNAELDGYQKELSMMPKNSAAYAKMLDNIIVLKADEVGKISALDAEIVEIQQTGAQRILQANLEAAQRTQEAWREALRPLDTYFTQSLNGILQGTETLQDVELSAARNITLSFVDMEAKKLLNALATDGAMVAHQLATQTRLTAATEAGETTRLATKEAANATGKSISLASGMAEINSDAMKAAAGAYASVSEIPVVGPFLAPAAGAAAYAAVMGYEVLSAEGGMTIPANVNPLTQLHEKEMVLPAYIAQPLMDLVMNGRSFSNQTTQTTGGDTHHVTVNNNMSANGIGAADFAHNVLQALDNSVRGGQINSGKYRALARALRRG